MRILFVSGELIGSAVVHQFLKEGHDVKLYIDHEDRRKCLDGIVPKVSNWEPELEWVGKDGLIVFDDVIFEGAQDRLREVGFSVFGGSSESDKLELNREHFQTVLQSVGINILPSFDFKDANAAITFVENNPGKWVVKQSTHIGILNYVGQCEDASDVLNILNTYKRKNISPVHLQRKVDGVEVAVGRYFNGNDWVGPININFEHKPLCNGDIGPLTAEMGTLAWYEENENINIYRETLLKIKPYLQSINYKGDIDINCIANREGVWPLEATMRLGTPTTELHCEIHKSPWGDFMKAIADGEQYELEFRRGYGIVVSVAVPPFPFAPEFFKNSDIQTSQGMDIFFRDDLTVAEMEQIHFEEVALLDEKEHKKTYYLAGKHGYALYVTGFGKTVKDAQENVYNVIKKIIIPRMFYRTDIGDKFIQSDEQKLREWGWI